MIKCRKINTFRDTINYITEERGITLTALVITIILLLILAGVGISVGRDTIESAKLMSFGTELQAIQSKVNELEQELQRKVKSNDTDEVNRIKNIGQNLQGNEQESLAFSGAEVSDTSGYRYYDKNTVEDLGF